MKKRVADIILSTLVERGIKDCFAVVGGGAMFLDNALLHNTDMKKYFNHHEQACAMAAESYARSSGKMALVCVTSGPGGTNTLTGVMGAWVDSLPMIVISGQVRYAVSVPSTGLKLRTRGVQEFNIIDTVKTMTKYSKLVVNPLDIKSEINKAVDISLSGRRGPVWLDIPQDVQSAFVEEEDLKEYEDLSSESNECDTEFILKEIMKSKRPVFLAGAGVLTSGCRENFRKLIEKISIPVVSSFNGSNVLYRENTLCMGPIGPCGQRAANIAVQNSDLIVSLGSSLGFSVTGFNQVDFAPKARIISVDIDNQELKKKGLKYLKQFNSDVEFVIDSLLKTDIAFNADEEWLDYCKKLKNRFTPFEAAENKKEDERVCSYVFWKNYFNSASKDSVLVLGNNSAITSALQIGNSHKNQQILTNYNCGSMGYDIPAAIGACVALNREVYLATGDGSIMMNIQELQTVKHHNFPIKILLFENAGYNAIRQTSKNFFNGELIGCTPETGVTFPDFSNVAKTFGFNYFKCEKNKDVKDCLDKFFEAEGPTIMEISQLIDDPVLPKVMSKTDINGKMLSPALHDMYPFISEEELKELMISER